MRLVSGLLLVALALSVLFNILYLLPRVHHSPPVELAFPRATRFPSVQRRVHLYLSDWFDPKCHGPIEYKYHDRLLLVREPASNHRTIEFADEPGVVEAFYVNHTKIAKCAAGDSNH